VNLDDRLPMKTADLAVMRQRGMKEPVVAVINSVQEICDMTARD
jgi:hypothetical protein